MVASVAVPAPNETLISWLERTAFYTGTTPLRLARDLQLVQKDGRISYFALSDEKARELSNLWLGKEESAHGLTLYGHYRVLREWQEQYEHEARHVAARAWIYLSGSRYCPQCLGETGVWKLDWKLPWITCCTEHEIVLADSCPHCHGWPRSDRRGVAEHLLQDRAATHPSLCKRPVGAHQPCGGNLANTMTPRIDPEVLSTTLMVQRVMHGHAVTLFGEPLSCVEAIRSWVEIALISLAATARTTSRQRLSPPRDISRCLMIITLIGRIFRSRQAEEAVDHLMVVIRGSRKPIDANWIRDVLPKQRTSGLESLTASLLERNGRLSTRLRRKHRRVVTGGSPSLAKLRESLEFAVLQTPLKKPVGVSDCRWASFVFLAIAYTYSGSWSKAAALIEIQEQEARRIFRHVTNRLDPSQLDEITQLVNVVVGTSIH